MATIVKRKKGYAVVYNYKNDVLFNLMKQIEKAPDLIEVFNKIIEIKK